MTAPHIQESPIPGCEFRTIDGLIRNRAVQYGERPFMYFEDDLYSYKDMDTISESIAFNLQKIGVSQGDRVALFLPNCPDFIFSWFAVMKIGAVEVPVNIDQKGELLEYLLNNCQARVMVTTSELFERILEIGDNLVHLKTVVLVDRTYHQENSTYFTLYSLDDFKNGQESLTEECDITPDSTFCFMYTSGTTGNSKGVVLPHNYAIYMGDMIGHIIGYTEKDRVYVCLPLFHGNAQMLAILPAMVAGASIVLERKFSATQFWDQVRQYGITVTNVVGSIIAMLHKMPPSESDRDHTLRALFTAATPGHILESFENRFGTKIYEGYGSTECGMVTMNTAEGRKIGSIGKTSPGYQVRIVDEQDQELPPGEIGEIVTRPNQPFIMMKEYYHMPKETLSAFRNLWFHTGDLGYYDEDGFFYFVDRKKDVIRRRGENISSMELERIINSHPDVVESAAIGVSSELGEEEVKVVVVRRNQTLTEEELIDYCCSKMARFMVPRYVEWAESLPKTPTQRVQKYKLKKAGVTEQTWDRESRTN